MPWIKMDYLTSCKKLMPFDGAYSRWREFVSLGLWVFHPSMRGLLRLASMEVRSEKTADIGLFWEQFNEMLAKITNKDNYKFNPKYIMCDEAGANFTGIETVYDDKFVIERVISCQWHFMNKVQDRVNKIGEQFQHEFVEVSTNMCRVKTVAEYDLILARLREIVDMFPEAGNFLEWYHVRRFQLFPAFRDDLHSDVNLAESGNAKWQLYSKLSLLQLWRMMSPKWLNRNMGIRGSRKERVFP